MIQKLKAAVRGLVAVVLMLFATNFLPVAAAYAGAGNNNSSDNDKVFVCKYVGTPHVDERLQTGQNPISVSTHAIQHNDWDGQVPGWFSDAHDRSYVLAYDVGQPEPDVDACPMPEGPTKITPPTLHTDVVCGPNNDVTNLTDSADKDHYTVSHQGNTYTVTAKSGYTFASGKTVTLTEPSDANTVCPPTKVTPGVQFTEPTCEHTTGAATVTAMNGVTYKVNGAAVSGTTSYPAGSAVTVTAVLASGYVLDSGAQSSFSHTFKAAPTDCTLGDTDVCPNITGDQATVPSGMTKDNSGNCVTPGGQGGDEGVVLSAATASPQLANTGENSLVSIIIGLAAVVMAAGLAIASRKQLSR
jgi:LPXTG-motif cell wall-anchored protein